MSNEQRAHDLTMFYVKMYYDSKRLSGKNFKYDAISEYVKLYPEVLKQMNIVFPN